MRILITNNRLDLRGGAESFVRDLARSLQALGHSVVAYSSDLGQKDRLLSYDQVPVTTNLAALPFKPDIIHAQHHLDAMTALAALPDVPAIYHCHGAVWRENPPLHPNILHYLAMSRTLAERMCIEASIPADNISLHFNTVDLATFSTIRQLPTSPRTALFYNGHHRPGSATLAAVKEASVQHGLTLDLVGRHFGRTFTHPHKSLPLYDVVFASGRSAIDALASGCAVVVLGRSSCGPLVRSDNFDHLRQVNFSIASNASPPSTQRILDELHTYNPADCAKVTQTLRQQADASTQAAVLLPLYQRVIGQHQSNPADLATQLRAMAHYLRQLTPLIKMTDDAQHDNGMPLSNVIAMQRVQQALDAFQHEWRSTT